MVVEKGIHQFDDMTNLSHETRQLLNDAFSINHIEVDTMQRSSDGTLKNAIRLHDGLVVESVLIQLQREQQLCVSSQVRFSV